MEDTMTSYQERQAAFNQLARVSDDLNFRCASCERLVSAYVPHDGRCGECYAADRKTALEYDCAVPSAQKTGQKRSPATVLAAVAPCARCGTRTHAGLDELSNCLACALVAKNLAEVDAEIDRVMGADPQESNGAFHRVTSSFGITTDGRVGELPPSKSPEFKSPQSGGPREVAVLARAASAQALRTIIQALQPTPAHGYSEPKAVQLSESMLKTLIEVAERADVLADRVIAESEASS
jgi:hypothetical protein